MPRCDQVHHAAGTHSAEGLGQGAGIGGRRAVGSTRRLGAREQLARCGLCGTRHRGYRRTADEQTCTGQSETIPSPIAPFVHQRTPEVPPHQAAPPSPVDNGKLRRTYRIEAEDCTARSANGRFWPDGATLSHRVHTCGVGIRLIRRQTLWEPMADGPINQ